MKVPKAVLASPTILRQLYEIGKDPTMSVSSSPFGPIEGTVVLKAAPILKGVKGMAAVQAINPRMAAGLSRAIAISRAHRERGVSLVVIRGQLRRVPTKAAAMARAVAA